MLAYFAWPWESVIINGVLSRQIDRGIAFDRRLSSRDPTRCQGIIVMWHGSRRDFLRTAGAVGGLALTAASARAATFASLAGQTAIVEVLNPRMRVPLSFIIDDSTCLVNMGRFCMPQFATAWPDRAEYKKPWKTWPVEIPDAFVREFGQWCAEHGVKGKYSVVPYPACVGWLDRELPGWSRQELSASLQLVRELMVPNWDIHPEMITHTRVIDLQTGRPLSEISDATMENSYPQTSKSVDELAAYLAYALRILKNCDLPCEGITTPGGFGGNGQGGTLAGRPGSGPRRVRLGDPALLQVCRRRGRKR